MSAFTFQTRYRGFLPVVLWALAISILSTDLFSARHTGEILYGFFPLEDSKFSILHMLVRKCAHVTEYAILGWLVVRALFNLDPQLERFSSLWRIILFAIVIGFLYASLDEFHQAFIPSRTPSVKDVIFDTLGTALGAIFRSHWLRQTKKYRICLSKLPSSL